MVLYTTGFAVFLLMKNLYPPIKKIIRIPPNRKLKVRLGKKQVIYKKNYLKHFNEIFYSRFPAHAETIYEINI